MAMKHTTAARRPVAPATAVRQVMSTAAWGRGRRQAAAELPALERRLVVVTASRASRADHAGREDRAALLPAQVMYQRHELTVCGYAALLWERLEARQPYEAYYSADGGTRQPCIWDGVQRMTARQWNVYAADLWAAWADDDGLPEAPVTTVTAEEREATR